MNILPTNDTDFKHLASVVVDEHYRTGDSIEDCIVDAAKKHELTPGEVRRLVEKTNTELSLRHLGGEDKKGEFVLAKCDDVLKRTHNTKPEEGAVEKTASFVLPNTRKRKTVSDIFTPGHIKTAEEKVFDHGDYFSLVKQYEKAKLTKMATENRVLDNLTWLTAALEKKGAPSLSKLASDATALYGKTVQPILRQLAKAQGVTKMYKQASEGTVIDDTTEYMQKLKDTCLGLQSLVKEAQRIDHMEKLISATKNILGGGFANAGGRKRTY